MTTADFLPLGQHRLDPGGPSDPVLVLLSQLWCDLVWTFEHAVSVDIHRRDNEPDDEAREFAYLPGCTDDALQNLARLIELLALGHQIDWRKPAPRASNPPYFRLGTMIPRAELTPFGRHPLDPASDSDPLRMLLHTGKEALVRLVDYSNEYRRARRADTTEADALAHRMSDTAQRASDLLARAIELLLLGHQLAPPTDSAALETLRTFKRWTATDWSAATHPTAMCPILRPLDHGVTVHFDPRKWRRFALACVRRVQHTFTDPRTLELVDAVEQETDGLLTAEELDVMWKQRNVPPNDDACSKVEATSPERRAARAAFQSLAHSRTCTGASRAVLLASCARAATCDPAEEGQAQTALLREIFGNPFTVRPAEREWLDWNGGTVPALARGIDAERAFDRMPILADALEDAGCTDAEILAHCREPHAHVRGCWVIDLLLGRHLLATNEEASPDENEPV